MTRLLIKRASVYAKAGHSVRRSPIWIKIAELIESDSDLRSHWLLEWLRSLNLWHLEHFEEAREILDWRVKPLTLELGNDLDRFRVRLLEARIAEGLGNPSEAVAAFQEVWQGFTRGVDSHSMLPLRP